MNKKPFQGERVWRYSAGYGIINNNLRKCFAGEKTIFIELEKKNMRTVAFYTLGCKVNQYETEAMEEQFRQAGYDIVPFSGPADVYVVNTCTVTAAADRKSKQAIGRARRTSPTSHIVVTGCFAQVSPEKAAALEGVDQVIGNTGKADIVRLVEEGGGRFVEEILQHKTYDNMQITEMDGRTRAFMKIEEGCNNFCSYCIIPYARGPVRSRDLAEICREAEVLAQRGYQEIVLTGIHLTSYGLDGKPHDLFDVIKALHCVEGIQRIRLGSLELNHIMVKIARGASQLPKLCPQFHISLQSGCDATLHRMNRRYTAQEYREAVQALREAYPNAAVTTDLMVGFPGETEQEFQQSKKFAEEIGFARIHVFPYSIRPGTRAADMPDQVPEPVKKQRAAQMQQVAETLHQRFCRQYLGQTALVLAERGTDGIFEGHTENYMTVSVKSSKNIQGQIVPVRITSVTDGIFIGELLPQEDDTNSLQL